MGNFVYQEAKKHGENVVCGVDKSVFGDFDCPVYREVGEIKDYADVIIDFSSPDALAPLLDFTIKTSTPLVIGTTAFTPNDEKKIINASKKIPIFKASNTSLGVNVLLKLCDILTKNLSGYDVEIVDYHHNQKKDAPSGTSYIILKRILSALDKPVDAIFGRKGEGKRKSDEICIHSVRGGNVVGEHEVFFFGENECVSVKHTAYSKALFADGALKAAKFIINKPNGLYDMDSLSE